MLGGKRRPREAEKWSGAWGVARTLHCVRDRRFQNSALSFRTADHALGDPVLVARKTNVAAEFRFADLLAELAEGAVIADADKNIGGAGRENRIWHEVGMLVAGELRRLAVHEVIRGVRMHDGEAGFIQR